MKKLTKKQIKRASHIIAAIVLLYGIIITGFYFTGKISLGSAIVGLLFAILLTRFKFDEEDGI